MSFLLLLAYISEVLIICHSSGYCQQMDTHQPTATVREALLFSACLRQPKEVPLEEKKA